MTLRIGDRVESLVDYFPPTQPEHGMSWFPMITDVGTVVAFEGLGPGDAQLYAIRFDDDTEASEDGATWTYALEELEIVS